MTLIDRYLLGRYWYVFCIGYAAFFGLYFVIDVFTNVGDFLDIPGGIVVIMGEVARYYSYRACAFFGAIGGTMEVIAAMTTLAMIQKNAELYPVLSAGVSTFRLLRPLVIGALVVNGILVANQELVIPRIALELQQNAGKRTEIVWNIEPAVDFSADISISGRRLNLRKRSIEDAEFVLRETRVATTLTPVTAREALAVASTPDQAGGWMLLGVKTTFDKLPLTDLGRKLIRPGDAADEIFVRTDVTFDQLMNRDSSYEYLSTFELMSRVRNPSFSRRSVKTQSLYLHTRLTKPLLNLVVVFVGVPFICRRESASLLNNVGVCATILGIMFGCNEFFQYLAKASLISGESAAWAPIILWGAIAAWCTGLVKT